MSHRRDPYLTNLSRQKAMRTEIKILEFEEALERQERSLKKLRGDEREDVSPEYHFERKAREVVPVFTTNSVEFDSMIGSVARREPKPYVPLSKQPQMTQNIQQKKKWEYLQSSQYQNYLEEIMSSIGNGKEIAQKIKSIRSNNIYLENKQRNTYKQQPSYEVYTKPTLQYIKRPSIPQILFKHSKNIEKQNNFQHQTMMLNCKPYLQSNSMQDQIQQQLEEESIQKEEFEQIQNAYPVYPQQQTYGIRIQQDYVPQTSNYRRKAQQNVKTVIKIKGNDSNNVLLASTKINIINNQQRQRQKKEFIQRQLSRYNKENRQKTQVAPSKTPKMEQKCTDRDRSPNITKKPQYQPSKKQEIIPIIDSPSMQQSRQFYRKDRMQVSTASLYNIDFKLDRPDRQGQSFARCTSAITLNHQRSISHNKSNSKIKMSLVTTSGRHGR